MRLKRYIETRGADSGQPDMMLAQSAFWTGIFYDPAALAAAAALIKPLSYQEILALRAAVPQTGIHTAYGAGTLRDLAREAVAIAADGLKNRAKRNAAGADETHLSGAAAGNRRRGAHPGGILAATLRTGLARRCEQDIRRSGILERRRRLLFVNKK